MVAHGHEIYVAGSSAVAYIPCRSCFFRADVAWFVVVRRTLVCLCAGDHSCVGALSSTFDHLCWSIGVRCVVRPFVVFGSVVVRKHQGVMLERYCKSFQHHRGQIYEPEVDALLDGSETTTLNAPRKQKQV